MVTTRNLDTFFAYVQEHGYLRTPEHAERWTRAVLQTLGLNLSRGAKRALARALPGDLSDWLTDVFWLVHFRNRNQDALDFQRRVARRAGNTDKFFARKPIVAVFGALRQIIGDDVAQRVANDLSAELRELWEDAVHT
jgi:uncharacterized protein (DUF2267 family)